MDTLLLTPYFLDQPRAQLRELASPGWTLIDPPLLSTGTTMERMSVLHRAIAEQVAAALAQGRRPVSLAGDCCTTIGVVAGLRRHGLDPLLVWLDAHGDFNTWETTPSGFLGGMPLAMLVGRGEQTLLHGVGLTPLAEDQVVLSDARDLDPGEREAVAESKVRHVPQVDDLPRVVTQLLKGGRPLYLHLDVDVLDPQAVPAVSYPAPGGPDPERLAGVLRALAATERIRAISMTCWNPELPGAVESRAVCLHLLDVVRGVA